MGRLTVADAQRATELLKQADPGIFARDVTKEMLVTIGQLLWSHTYKLSQNDYDVNPNILDYIETMAIHDPVKALIFGESLKIPDQQVSTFAAARWVDQGLPIIRLGHKRAAAFMATTIGEENVEFIKPPFKAFYIEMPDQLLMLTGHDGEQVSVKGVLVHVMNLKGIPMEDGQGDVYTEDAERWRWIAITDTSLVQWELNRKLEELAGYNVRENNWDGVGLPIEDYDQRLSMLVGRLICSVCLMMSSPGDLKVKTQAVSRNKNGKRPLSDAPSYRIFMESKPISIDVRPAIRSYLRGDRDSPSVRLLVRGHWKNQAHGPGHSLRKHIHIEPYWRGGVDGDPIMQRVYNAEGDT
jgi:hypothetical protein